eukprot:scaffold234091_cov24-Tisochrysis_lutea.AAC.1
MSCWWALLSPGWGGGWGGLLPSQIIYQTGENRRKRETLNGGRRVRERTERGREGEARERVSERVSE